MLKGWMNFFFWSFVAVFVVTGALSLIISIFGVDLDAAQVASAKATEAARAAALKAAEEGKPLPARQSDWDFGLLRWTRPIFGTHMFCWMVLGIIAKQIWEAYKMPDLPTDWLDPVAVVMPLLLSPIIFYPVYSLWTQNPNKVEIVFVLNLMAFQTGFFWQTLLESARAPLAGAGRVDAPGVAFVEANAPSIGNVLVDRNLPQGNPGENTAPVRV